MASDAGLLTAKEAQAHYRHTLKFDPWCEKKELDEGQDIAEIMAAMDWEQTEPELTILDREE